MLEQHLLTYQTSCKYLINVYYDIRNYYINNECFNKVNLYTRN